MSRPPRIDGFSYIGRHRYFITFCTADRRPVFCDTAVGEFAASQLRRTCRRYEFALLAYCIMPDHVHLLVEGSSETSDLKHMVKSAKQRSGQSYAARHGRALWQEGFYDRVLRDNDDPKKIARYIVENPVRAGLVESPLDYPLLGSGLCNLRELIEGL